MGGGGVGWLTRWLDGTWRWDETLDWRPLSHSRCLGLSAVPSPLALWSPSVFSPQLRSLLTVSQSSVIFEFDIKCGTRVQTQGKRIEITITLILELEEWKEKVQNGASQCMDPNSLLFIAILPSHSYSLWKRSTCLIPGGAYGCSSQEHSGLDAGGDSDFGGDRRCRVVSSMSEVLWVQRVPSGHVTLWSGRMGSRVLASEKERDEKMCHVDWQVDALAISARWISV